MFNDPMPGVSKGKEECRNGNGKCWTAIPRIHAAIFDDDKGSTNVAKGVLEIWGPVSLVTSLDEDS
jgi:hypothetical protein